MERVNYEFSARFINYKTFHNFYSWRGVWKISLASKKLFCRLQSPLSILISFQTRVWNSYNDNNIIMHIVPICIFIIHFKFKREIPINHIINNNWKNTYI